MLATRADRVPTGPEWVHEVKWDGMRVLADIHGGRLTLTSRLGNDVTTAYPELAPLADLYDDALLDAEIVVFDRGRPSFGALAERMHVRSPRKALALSTTRPVTLMVFDLLRLFGSDLTAQPWRARRELLERLEIDGRHWQVPPTYDNGVELHAATAEQGLEGVVSKRRDSPYAAGRRSADWLKVPHRNLVSAVVGGWRPRRAAPAMGTPPGSARSSSGCPGATGCASSAGSGPDSRERPGSPCGPPSKGWQPTRTPSSRSRARTLSAHDGSGPSSSSTSVRSVSPPEDASGSPATSASGRISPPLT